MIREALDDAGLTLADVDGVCHSRCSSMGLAEYLGIHPRYTDSTKTGGSSFEIHVEHAAAAIAAGLCDVVVGVYAATPRSDRKQRRGGCGSRRMPGAEPDARVGDALRPAHADGRLRAGRQPAHGRVRHHVASSSPRSRSSTRQWATHEPQRPLPGPDHHRRRARLADAGVAAAPARLLPGHRRRRRVRDDVSAERARDLRKPPVYVLGAGTCHDHSMISEMPDLTTTPGAVSGPTAFAHGRHQARRRRRAHGLRLVHHHRPAAPRGPRLLRQGRGRRRSSMDGKLGPGGSLPMNTNGGGLSYTHPGHVRHVPARRGGAPAARRVRRAPGRRRRDRGRPRLRRRAVEHVAPLVLGTEATPDDASADTPTRTADGTRSSRRSPS